jgi:hypothetical protein
VGAEVRIGEGEGEGVASEGAANGLLALGDASVSPVGVVPGWSPAVPHAAMTTTIRRFAASREVKTDTKEQ